LPDTTAQVCSTLYTFLPREMSRTPWLPLLPPPPDIVALATPTLMSSPSCHVAQLSPTLTTEMIPCAMPASLVGVRINCIGLVGLHHLFYKGAAGPLGLQGCATPGATSPVAATLSGASPGASPLGLQGRQPIRVSGGAPPLVPPPLKPALGGLPPL
jgi:hypothetical protein